MPAADAGSALHGRGFGFALALLLVTGLSGCAATGSPNSTGADANQVPTSPPPTTQVFVYPASGQSPAKLDRDRYECHMWAVKQTGFDPSMPQLAPHQRVEVVAMPPPGTGVIAGAATGAILGAAVSEPYNQGSGAAVGAVAGAVLGAASDAARQQEANRIQSRYNQHDLQQQARLELQATDYRRAVSACLEGRNYTVK